jgi:hypothetical protein
VQLTDRRFIEAVTSGIGSPECGPAPVTTAPSTHQPGRDQARCSQSPRGMGGSAESPARRASVTINSETRKCVDTIHGFNPVKTLIPPMQPARHTERRERGQPAQVGTWRSMEHHDQSRHDRDCGHRDGHHPVPELDRCMDSHRAVRDVRRGSALRPGWAAEPRTCLTHQTTRGQDADIGCDRCPASPRPVLL